MYIHLHLLHTTDIHILFTLNHSLLPLSHGTGAAQMTWISLYDRGKKSSHFSMGSCLEKIRGLIAITQYTRWNVKDCIRIVASTHRWRVFHVSNCGREFAEVHFRRIGERVHEVSWRPASHHTALLQQLTVAQNTSMVLTCRGCWLLP